MRSPDVLINDSLGVVLTELIQVYNPIHILEIGSAEGHGSTKVITEAIKGTDCNLYCIEMDKVRFDHLRAKMQPLSNVFPYHAASIDVDGMMDRDYIEKFKIAHPTHTLWKVMTMAEIYLWYDNSVRQIPSMEIKNGIDHIKNLHGIEFFDMVFIDGSPFTGYSELKSVYGADLIVLDDTMDIKCYDAFRFLLNDPNYTLIERNDSYRTGYAVFKNNERP